MAAHKIQSLPDDAEVKELLEKYKKRIKKELNVNVDNLGKTTFSREYTQFKKEYVPKKRSFYEKACNLSEKILRIKVDKKKGPLLQEAINIAHLGITPAGAISFSILAPILLILIGGLVSFAIFNSIFFVMFFLIIGALMLSPLANIPFFIANRWRMKASNQMVLCVFYIVTFMRHTSNLERAIDFAAEYLKPPLSLDLKKVLWDVETQKYESVKESLDNYLETWRKWNREFIESFHLIESSLYEPSESRRLGMLDKSLDVILSETYEKMLHYAHNLKSPITMLHMLGIILPILGLVILPLVVNFFGGVKWYHIAALYNILIPFGVYYLGKSILSKRPTGYGESDISEDNPEFKKYKNIVFNFLGMEIKINPLYLSIFVGFVLLLIGLSPLLIHAIDPGFDFPLSGEEDASTSCGYRYCFLGYRMSKATELTPSTEIGPYGLGASVFSLFVILGIAFSFGLYYKLRSKNVIKIRNKTKKLEDEFASALFQLGNRLGDGLPAEIAFGKVANIMKDTVSGNFFNIVSSNIRKLGMSVKDAIFNVKTGALVFFPSAVIESSMKMLIQSIKKGPKVAAQALVNISRYIKEIHKVNERLKDLMADVISSMKSQIKFMTPAIAGIVIGITSMITSILGKLGKGIGAITEGTGDVAVTDPGLFFGDGIPTYFFQIVVGLYVIQIVYILTILANGIENGEDKLSERYNVGTNLVKSLFLYFFIAVAIMVLFNIIAGRIMDVTVAIG